MRAMIDLECARLDSEDVSAPVSTEPAGLTLLGPWACDDQLDLFPAPPECDPPRTQESTGAPSTPGALLLQPPGWKPPA